MNKSIKSFCILTSQLNILILVTVTVYYYYYYYYYHCYCWYCYVGLLFTLPTALAIQAYIWDVRAIESRLELGLF
jgi:hypothetical protein